jgi:hypothetical protein
LSAPAEVYRVEPQDPLQSYWRGLAERNWRVIAAITVPQPGHEVSGSEAEAPFPDFELWLKGAETPCVADSVELPEQERTSPTLRGPAQEPGAYAAVDQRAGRDQRERRRAAQTHSQEQSTAHQQQGPHGMAPG